MRPLVFDTTRGSGVLTLAVCGTLLMSFEAPVWAQGAKPAPAQAQPQEHTAQLGEAPKLVTREWPDRALPSPVVKNKSKPDYKARKLTGRMLTLTGCFGTGFGVLAIFTGIAKSNKSLDGSSADEKGKMTTYAGLGMLAVGVVALAIGIPVWVLAVGQSGGYSKASLDQHHEKSLAKSLRFGAPATVNVTGWSGRF